MSSFIRWVWAAPVLFASSLAFAEGGATCTKTTADNSPGSEATGATSSLTAYNGGAEANTKAQTYLRKAKECTSASYSAQSSCIEACSAPMQQGISQSDTNGDNVTPTSGNKSGEEKRANDQQLANQFQNFMAACGPAREKCSDNCKEADQALDEVSQAVDKVQCDAEQDKAKKAACNAAKSAAKSKISSLSSKEKNKSDLKAGQGKQNQCDADFSKVLADALKMLAGLLGALAQDKSGNTSQNTDTAAAAATTTDCSVEPYASTETCKCDLSLHPENVRYCGENKQTQYAGVTGMGGVNTGGDLGNATSSGASIPGSDNSGLAAPLTGGSASAAGAGGGLVGGGMGGGGATAGKDGKETDAKRTPANANIYSGGDGGGGGSAGGSSYDGGSSDDAKKKGGRKGLGMSALAKATASGPLTGGGGRTNWEKVKLRYQDNTPTFLKEEGSVMSSSLSTGKSQSSAAPPK